VCFHGRNVGLPVIGAAAKNPWVSDSRNGCVGKELSHFPLLHWSNAQLPQGRRHKPPQTQLAADGAWPPEEAWYRKVTQVELDQFQGCILGYL
jgi:hypothetical protein